MCIANSIQVCITITRKRCLLIIEQPYSTSTMQIYDVHHVSFLYSKCSKALGRCRGTRVACKNGQRKAKYIYHVSMCDKSGNGSVNE